MVADIGTIPSPEYDLVRREFIPERLDQKRDALNKEIQVVKKEIQTQTEMRQILKDSTDSLQNTIIQLLMLQKESREKNVEFTEQSRRTLQESQSVFWIIRKISGSQSADFPIEAETMGTGFGTG